MLTRLIYYSENCLGAPGTPMIAGLNEIMDSATRNNQRHGITGALLFDPLWFVQILEGERSAVSATLRSIIADERHSDLVIMDARPFEERMFGKWWMGLGMLRGDNDALYARLGLPPKFDPRQMSAEQVLALALEIGRSGLARQLSATAA